LQLYNSSGTSLLYVDSNWSGGSEGLVYTTPTTAGTYYIGVSGYSGSTGDFLLDIRSSGSASQVDTVGNTWQTAASGVLSIGGAAVRGVVDSGADEDVYSIDLTANTNYLFNLASTSLDGTLALYGSAGEWLNSADYGVAGGDEQLSFTPSTTGKYYVSAGGWSSSTGSFDLIASVLTAVSDDVPGNTSSTASLGLPGFVDSQISSAIDKDWFAMRMNSGNEYIFDLSSGSGLLDGQLQIFNADGAPVYDSSGSLVFADNGWYAGDAEHLSFAPQLTGDYFIQVSGFGGSTGSYSLTSVVAVNPATINWSGITSSADVRWNTLDWVGMTLSDWHDFNLSNVSADNISWSQLQYEHLYDATAPTTGYTGWAIDNNTDGNPGNERILGGSLDDRALLGVGLDYFSGDAGDDYVDGGAGADYLIGGLGDDYLIGGDGGDVLNGGVGNNVMEGGAGNDTYYVYGISDSVDETDT
jgi:Ca2+-binding RTX toxin-like protein